MPAPLRIHLEIEPGGPPISGRLRDEDLDRWRSFTGWIGLLAALSEAVGGTGAGTDEVRAFGADGARVDERDRW